MTQEGKTCRRHTVNNQVFSLNKAYFVGFNFCHLVSLFQNGIFVSTERNTEMHFPTYILSELQTI
jgi:hypothetical protein